MELATLYRDIVETSPDAIWVFDLEGRILYANPALRALLEPTRPVRRGPHRLRHAGRRRAWSVRRPPRAAASRTRQRRRGRDQVRPTSGTNVSGSRSARACCATPTAHRPGAAPAQRLQRPAPGGRGPHDPAAPAGGGTADRSDRQLGLGRRERPDLGLRRADRALRPRPGVVPGGVPGLLADRP